MTGQHSPRTLGTGDIVAGRFRITGTVGKGAMGAVYAAQHTATHQAVALKFMELGDDDAEEFATRFEQEARVMAALRNSNTIRIYDFGRTDDGAMFMAMELLIGQGLDKRIRENTRQGLTMSEPEAASIGIQILKSLSEAHGHGLVHRDLKPGNVFLTDDGSGDTLVKVLDFGIARVQNSALTNAGRVLGTPSYMSPEQWQGLSLDGRADLYAVGALLYCCVTGKPPFAAGENMMLLMQKHCQEMAPDPRTLAKEPLSDAFVQVIQTALAKAPSERYSDAKAMRAALETALGGAWAGTPANLANAALRGAISSTNVEVPVPWNAQKTLSMDTGLGKKPSHAAGLVIAVAVAALLATVAAGGAAWWWLRSKPAASAQATEAPAVVPAVQAGAPTPPSAQVQVPVPAPVVAPEAVQPAAAPVAVVPAPAVPPAPVDTPPPAQPPAAAAAEPSVARRPAKPREDKPTERKKNASGLQMVD